MRSDERKFGRYEIVDSLISGLTIWDGPNWYATEEPVAEFIRLLFEEIDELKEKIEIDSCNIKSCCKNK